MMDEFDFYNLEIVGIAKRILREPEQKGCIEVQKLVLTKHHLKASLIWSIDEDYWNKTIVNNKTRMELHSKKR